jgi:hypothetical protein
VFTRTLDTGLGPLRVEFHPAGWCVSMTDVHLVERLSFDEQRVVRTYADTIQNSPAARTSFAADDAPVPAGVNVAARRERLVAT